MKNRKERRRSAKDRRRRARKADLAWNGIQDENELAKQLVDESEIARDLKTLDLAELKTFDPGEFKTMDPAEFKTFDPSGLHSIEDLAKCHAKNKKEIERRIRVCFTEH